MNYDSALAQMTGRTRDRRKIANNTYLERRDDSTIALKLHNTDVVTFKANGDTILNSGGWHTVTTKDRINMAVRVNQDKGIWYVQGKRFEDGITVHANGKITGAGKDDDKADNKLKARAKKYAQLCADSLPLGQPSSGDCWYCSMVTTDGDTLGDAIKDTDHLDSHMQEGYVVPSLVYNALKASGAGPAYFWGAFKAPEKSGEQKTFEKIGGNNYMLDIARQQVKKSVYRFIMRRFGFAC